MDASQIPPRIALPFANSGDKISPPSASQSGVTPGAASLYDGFPPVCSQRIEDGGVPPRRQDINGIFYDITAILRWQCAGGGARYDSTFATAIGGYPKGAMLTSADGENYWRNDVDGNTTNPDSGGTNWVPIGALSDSTPVMNGTASAGVSELPSRSDHVHPTDTTRAPIPPVQTWQLVTSMRAVDVTYTNSTGHPITVAITVAARDSGMAAFYVNGVQLVRVYMPSNPAGTLLETPMTMIVPAGSTYKLDVLDVSGMTFFWYELR